MNNNRRGLLHGKRYVVGERSLLDSAKTISRQSDHFAKSVTLHWNIYRSDRNRAPALGRQLTVAAWSQLV